MLVESSSRSLFVESRSWMCQCTCADGCLSVCLRRSSSRRWFQCTATRLLPRGVRESIQTKNERIVSFDVIVHYLNTRHTRPVYCRWLQSSSPALQSHIYPRSSFCSFSCSLFSYVFLYTSFLLFSSLFLLLLFLFSTHPLFLPLFFFLFLLFLSPPSPRPPRPTL